jgi:hypothetical protein
VTTSSAPVQSKDWRDQAACRTIDPELFYPTAQSGPEHQAQVAKAKAVCARCPVWEQCRTWAIEDLPHGIAGGLTETERSYLRGTDQRTRRATRTPRCPARPVAATQTETAMAGREALRAGQTVAQVAAEFGVSDRTVWRWAQRARAEQTQPAGAGR